MRPVSVRMRLTLWSTGTLALVLISFAAVVLYTIRVQLNTSLNNDLAIDAQRAGAHFRLKEESPFAALLAEDGGKHGYATLLKYVAHYREGARLMPSPLDRYANRSWRILGPDGHALLMPGVLPKSLTESKDPRDQETAAQLSDLFRAQFLRGDPAGDAPWDRVHFNLSLKGTTSYSTVIDNGVPTRVFSEPFKRDGRIVGVIQSAHSLMELDHMLARLQYTLLFVLIPLALLASAVGGMLLTYRALQPVREIAQAAEEVGADDLSRRLPVTSGDEFGHLACTFNRMMARLEEAFHKLETSYEQQKRFTGDASHELRTPLTAIKANTSLALQGRRTVRQYQEALTAADHAADVMRRMVEDLLLLARSDSEQLDIPQVPVDMAEVLTTARDTALYKRTTATSIVVETGEMPLLVSGDMHHLVRLMVNLVENALRHTAPEGRIRLSCRANGDEVITEVEDTGEGIAPEHLPHVFERFYRVDAARSRAHGGTGLGLAICASIVAAHRGSLSVRSTVGVGTAFTIVLPRVHASDGRVILSADDFDDVEPVPEAMAAR